MTEQERKRHEEMNKIELIIGHVLRLGVITAAIVIILGLVLALFTGQTGYPAGTFPTTFTAIFHGVLIFKPFAITMLGLFLLILTPVLRVIVSIYAFAKEDDQMYVWITTLVLVILLFAMWIGYHGK